MKKVAIATDSNSGITKDLANELNIKIVPMIFSIDGKDYLEGISIKSDEFFSLQDLGADIKSSQPSIGDIIEIWEEILKEYDEIVYIPMSKSLSSSYDTAAALSNDYDGRVKVVDNQRISATQKQSVIDACKLAREGKTAEEIKKILEETRYNSSIYIMVDTLKYLKKGGRITPAGAAIGEALNIKPVLQIQGGKLDAYAKVRGIKKAKSSMIQAIKNDIDKRFSETVKKNGITIHAAYSGNLESGLEWKKELEENFPGYTIDIDELSLNICTHIGKGAIGVGITCNL